MHYLVHSLVYYGIGPKGDDYTSFWEVGKGRRLGRVVDNDGTRQDTTIDSNGQSIDSDHVHGRVLQTRICAESG